MCRVYPTTHALTDYFLRPSLITSWKVSLRFMHILVNYVGLLSRVMNER